MSGYGTRCNLPGKIMSENETHRFFRYWFPVLFYCLVIFIQSSYPQPEQIPQVVNIDKLLHVVGYALLGVLFLRGFRNSRFANEYTVIMAASILLTGLYGASDELHQYYVPYRNGNIWDLLFDFLGGIIGVYVYKLLLERYPKIGRI